MINPKQETTIEATASIVTTIEKHCIVAHSYNDTEAVDKLWELGDQAKKLTKEWEKAKVNLRARSKEVLASIKKTNMFSKLVLFHGSKGNYIEVQGSTKKKEVSQDLVDEATFHHVDNVLTEEREVILTGPLAKWAIENLPKYTTAKTLEDHFVVNRRYILGESFVEAYEASTDMKPLYDRLKDAGFNAPSVECKVTK